MRNSPIILRKLQQEVSTKLKHISNHPNLEAKAILRHCLQKSATELILHSDETVSSKAYQDIQDIVKQRLEEKPLAYIIKTTNFLGYDLYVNENVLIPRPETEGLVQIVIEKLKETRNKPVHLHEWGVGSGCITVSVAKELEKLNKKYHYWGIEPSPQAKQIAQKNLGQWLEDKNNVALFTSTTQLEVPKKGQDDYQEVVISNPPYIKSDNLSSLSKSVKDYEPWLALDGGKDGLDTYKEIFQFLNTNYNKQNLPWLFLEIDAQVLPNAQIIFRSLYSQVDIRKDLFGEIRYLVALS